MDEDELVLCPQCRSVRFKIGVRRTFRMRYLGQVEERTIGPACSTMCLNAWERDIRRDAGEDEQMVDEEIKQREKEEKLQRRWHRR